MSMLRSQSPKNPPRIRVLFVCMGNICRSPAAEGIFRTYVDDAGLSPEIVCDSAGTIDYHTGRRPDSRMLVAASKRGFRLTSRARQFRLRDFDDHDLIVLMDEYNHEAVLRMARNPDDRKRVVLMGDFHPDRDVVDIPDPYEGGRAGFELVLDLLEVACRRLLDQIRTQYGLPEAEST